MKLSAVILAKNEERNIQRCIESVKFSDEVVIIDDESTDKTKLLAEKSGAIVFSKPLRDDFAGQRNYAMIKARGDWLLFVDADEIVTEELKKEVLNLFRSDVISKKSAYYIKRRDFWWGRELKFGETRKVREQGLLRLLRRDSGKWQGNVHEVFLTTKNIGKLQSFLDHLPHPTVKEFLRSINYYSTLRARELSRQGRSSNIVSLVYFPVAKFMLTYFIKLGFLDGPAGFAYNFLMSFHSFLVRAKLYQYTNVDIKRSDDRKDIF